MSFVKKSFYFMLPVACLLTGCNKQSNYSYLIKHPAELFQQYSDCQSAAEKSPERVAECQKISDAAIAIKTDIQHMQDDPEAFGQQILDNETAWMKTREELQQAQQSLQSLKTKNASAADINAAVLKMNTIEQQCRKQDDEIKMMLGAVGLYSPE
jgi:chromosome segregation ATPase